MFERKRKDIVEIASIDNASGALKTTQKFGNGKYPSRCTSVMGSPTDSETEIMKKIVAMRQQIDELVAYIGSWINERRGENI